MFMNGFAVIVCCLCVPSVYPAPLASPTCEAPEFPLHGWVVMPHRRVGGTVLYCCNKGYVYTGTKTHVCQPDGQWKGTVGQCEEIQCPELVIPSHGSVEYTGRGYKHTATVTCDAGYVYNIQGAGPLICEDENKWNSKPGRCKVVRCPPMSSPKHGVVEYSGKGLGDIARVECNRGYTYSRPEAATSTCREDHTWSRPFHGECQKVLCPPVPQVQYGFASSSSRLYGGTVNYTCLKGYVLQGLNSITCNADSHWSADPGDCITQLGLFIGTKQFEQTKELFNMVWKVVVFILLASGVGMMIEKRCKRSQKNHLDSIDGTNVVRITATKTESNSLKSVMTSRALYSTKTPPKQLVPNRVMGAVDGGQVQEENVPLTVCENDV